MCYKTLVRYSLVAAVLFTVSCSTPEKPVTKEEAKNIANTLTNSIAHRQHEQFNALLDMDTIKKRIAYVCENKLNEAMLDGAMSTIKQGELGKQVISALGKTGTYELVKMYEKNNRQHLVFRLYNDQLNYHDFELFKKGDKIKAADIFIYTTGENITNTLAQSLTTMDAQFAKTKNLDDRVLHNIQLIKKYIQQKDYERADELYQELPPLLKRQKLYKMINIQIASGLDNEKYLASLEKFQQEYPDAPNLYLLMVDAYFLKQDYAGALRCVNSIDSLINKDPFLDYYRALLYKQMGDKDNQRTVLEQLNQTMPGFGSGILELIYHYVENKQYDKAIPLVQRYKKLDKANEATIDALYLLHPEFKKKVESN